MTDYIFKNKVLFYFFLLVLVAGGIYSFMSMSKLEDPEVEIKQALIVTLYPGASAHEVELQVTDVIEKAIREMGNLDHIESRSEADYSEITVQLHTTVDLEDTEQLWDILRRKVNRATADLPANAETPMVIDDFGDVFGLFYAMTADGFSYDEMHDYGMLVKKEMEAIPDVKRVSVYGNRPPAIYIQLKQSRMANLGVHPAEVLLALQDQNQAVYAGYFEGGRERIRIDVDEGFDRIDDIRNLIIQGHEGDQVRLADIATVERSLREPYREAMRHNKQPALGISIAMESGGNIIELGKKTDEKLAALKSSRIPAGIDFEKVFFQPEKVSSAINTFMSNLAQSVTIVILVLMLAMGWRSGMIIGSGLIITILGSLVILNLFDGTLQRVSLSTFILAMGMLVDNAVVIVDGILTDLQGGMKKDKALVNTVHKTARPLIGATLIAILAFLPIFLSPDTAGEYVRDLFIVLAVSLLLSWVLALTQAPLMASYQFDAARIKEKFKGKQLHSSRIYRVHRNALQYILCHKTMAIAAVLVLLAITALLFRFVPRTFFPDLSYSQLYIEYRLPAGSRIQAVDEDLAEIEDYLLDKPGVTNVTTSLGGTPSRYNLVRSIAKPSMRYGELIVSFTDADVLLEHVEPIQDYLLKHYPQAYARVKRYNLMYKEFPVEVMFSGPDPAVLKELAAEAKEIMEEEPAAVLVTDNWEPASKVRVAGYNLQKARQAGLSRSDVALSLLSSTDGLPIGHWDEGNRAIPIIIKHTGEQGGPVDDLERAPAFSALPALPDLDPEVLQQLMAGTLEPADFLDAMTGSVPLNHAVDDIAVQWEEPVVHRYNGQRAIKAQSNPAHGKTADDVRGNILEAIENIELPAGYRMEWQGEYEASSEAQEYLFMYLPLSIILIIAILIALFNSLKLPLIIIMSLPLAFIGIVPGLFVAGKAFGFVAIVGTIGLMGMMIKNGVVLLEEVRLQINTGKDRFDALMDASASRLRPVMMASLTTILGMVPLVRDDMFGSMAVTIMSGLLLGSLITLMMMPVFYAVLYRVVSPNSKKAKKRQKS
ncbi:MAG: efflux RND transporter permease subunit [Bacteroidota bacterium]